jgi:raffinose/stachyose/melibiose transport system permease protein
MFSGVTRHYTWTFQVALTVLAVIFAFPLGVMVLVSLRGQGIGNYVAVLQHPMIPRFFLNSIVVTLCTIVLVYMITMLSAYAFSKLPLRGKNVLFSALLVGLLLPGVAILVPLFFTIRSLGLMNNYLALILPYTAFALPFTTLLARNFLDGLPNELIDAARIDGCNSFTALTRVVMPLSKPISVVVIIWTFLSAWNEYFLVLLFMQDDQMKTLTHAPQFFVGVYSQDTGKIFATLVLISLPIMIAYLLLQRYFESGMTSGALK